MTGSGITAALRTIAQLHEHPILLRWAQTPAGRFAIWAAAALLFAPYLRWLALLPVLGLLALFPERRRVILSLSAIPIAAAFLIQRFMSKDDLAQAEAWLNLLVVSLFVLLFLSATLTAARFFSRLPAVVQRSPQLCLHLVFWGVLAMLWLTPSGTTSVLLHGGERHRGEIDFLITAVLSYLIWRCGYLLQSGRRGKAAGTRIIDHLFYLWPVWGGTNVPFGMGADHLFPRETKSPDALARVQLAGLKLLILALIWRGVNELFGAVVFGNADSVVMRLIGDFHFNLPSFSDLLNGRATVSPLLAWASLYVELFRMVLWIALIGHPVVGALRLCGFSVYRNTYRPLLSETIVEFWGRFYFYFKELLVEFFFYPTYQLFSRFTPGTRLFAAVFASAAVGNAYYHVLGHTTALATADFAPIGSFLFSYSLYGVLLAIGIFVSMIRERKRRRQGAVAPDAWSGLRRARRILGVWTFYAIIHIWDAPVGGEVSFLDRTRFFLSLFGLENVIPSL